MKQDRNVEAESLERGYEVSDAWPKTLVVCGGVLIGLILLVMSIADVMLSDLEEGAREGDVELHPLAMEGQLPPAPRLQINPAEDLAEHRAIEYRLLHSYESLDAENGVVRIPITRAMELIVERGGQL